MKNRSRTKNVTINSLVSLLCQVLNLLLNFLTRTIFIKILGAEYLGVNGLFSNILTILSFAELGIGNAIVFNLYKPLAQDDKPKISSLMLLYKQAYTTIGLFVLGAGLLVTPFLGVIIKTKPNIPENISLLYILFLLNTARGNAPCFGNLLDGFGFGLKVVILNILEAVFIGLWSMLLLFPGIIAYYRYSQAIYILVDDPTKSPMQCIRESKAMMAGHKGELFALDLSFLGWYLLSLVPMLGYAVRVWTVPYIGMTKTLYFEALRSGAAYTRDDTFNFDI